MTTSQRTSICPRSVLQRSAPCRPPLLTCDPLPRSELFDRLETVVPQHGAHIVVCQAPAGTGKTVLVQDWIERRLRANVPATTFAWLTVTEALDRDPGRLPVVAAALCEALGTPPPPDLSTPVNYAAYLVEALTGRVTPTVLVLDDVHLITDSFLLAGLEYLVRHAPHTVTIVLSGRHRPPLRWHALDLEGRLTRIGTADLALTRSQAAQLFRQHGRALTEPELDTVLEITQGWTAMVRLGALLMSRDAQDSDAGLALLARPAPGVADFIVGELLHPLPDHIVEFLLRTSIPDAFTEALADELVGARTRETLDELQHRGFPFTRRSEGGELWFVYHPLVLAYLRSRAQAHDELPQLRRRTARWLCDAGHPLAALPHLLDLIDRDPLRKFVCDNGLGLVFDGAGPQLLGAIDRAGSGLADDPFVWRLRAVDALTRGEDREALAYLDLIRSQPASIPSLAPQSWLDAMKFAVTIDAVLNSGASIDDLDTELPATGNLDIDCYLAVQTASAMLLRGRIERGEALLRSGITLAERTGRHRLVLGALTRLTVSAIYAGAITTARTRAENAVEYAREHDLHDAADVPRMRLAIALTRYAQGEDIDTAGVAEILAQWHASERSGMPVAGLPTLVACHYLLSRRDAPDLFDAVHRLRANLMQLLACDPLPAGSQGVVLPGALRSLLQLREIQPARELLDRARTALGDTPEVILGQAMLAATEQKPRSVRALLEPLLLRGSGRIYPPTEVCAWLRYTSALHRLGLPSKAAQALETALRIAERDTLISPWLDVPEAIELLDIYAGRFGRLDAFADRLRHHPAAVRHGALPPLTASETTVLKHLPSGRTTGQIAADLGVSINTVKTHLRGIYTKLDANTRVHAVERARLVGLL